MAFKSLGPVLTGTLFQVRSDKSHLQTRNAVKGVERRTPFLEMYGSTYARDDASLRPKVL